MSRAGVHLRRMADRGAAGPFIAPSLHSRLDGSIAIVLEASDTPVSVELQRAYFADIASRYPGWSPDLIPSADPAEVAAPLGAWVVAYLDGRPVGCGGVKRLDASSAELKRIYLADSARGHGLGRRILQQLEQHARDLGYERLRLDTGDRQPKHSGSSSRRGISRYPTTTAIPGPRTGWRSCSSWREEHRRTPRERGAAASREDRRVNGVAGRCSPAGARVAATCSRCRRQSAASSLSRARRPPSSDLVGSTLGRW